MSKRYENEVGRLPKTLRVDGSENTYGLADRIARTLAVSSLLACTLLTGAVPLAYGATWPLSASELSVKLGYHDTYSAAGATFVHTGIDVDAPAGSQVRAPLDGQVSFIGSVPSGDARVGGAADAETMQAVSIEIEDGRTVTLMPFEAVDVQVGQRVAEGACLGALAVSGDPSSAAPHLHMGLKRGRAYYDPMSLFSQAQSQQSAASVQDVAAAPAASPVSVQPKAEAQSSAGLQARSTADAALAPAPSVSTAVEPSAGHEEQRELSPRERSISSAGVSWQPRQVEQPSLTTTVGQLFEPLASACSEQLADFEEGLHSLADALHVPAAVLVLALGVCAVVALCTSCLLVLRVTAPVVLRAAIKEIAPLSRLRGGGILHKLFPAPGTAFTSRGR